MLSAHDGGIFLRHQNPRRLQQETSSGPRARFRAKSSDTPRCSLYSQSGVSPRENLSSRHPRKRGTSTHAKLPLRCHAHTCTRVSYFYALCVDLGKNPLTDHEALATRFSSGMNRMLFTAASCTPTCWPVVPGCPKDHMLTWAETKQNHEDKAERTKGRRKRVPFESSETDGRGPDCAVPPSVVCGGNRRRKKAAATMFILSMC